MNGYQVSIWWYPGVRKASGNCFEKLEVLREKWGEVRRQWPLLLIQCEQFDVLSGK